VFSKNPYLILKMQGVIMKYREQPELEYIEHIKEAPIKCRIVSFISSSPHWHYEYEAFLVLQGAVNIHCETGNFRLEKKDLMQLNSHEIHSITPAEKDNLCFFMQWSPAMLLEFYDSSFRFNLNTQGKNPPTPETAALFRNVLAEIGLLLHEKPDGYQFSLKSCVYRFISLLFGNVSYSIAGPNNSIVTAEQLAEFDRIKQYIKEHFREKLNIEKLCRKVAMSRSRVFRIMKNSGSNSMKDLLNYYRVEYAKNLLANSTLSIPFIATECGFESDSSFYRIFKKFTNFPPNQYRSSPREIVVPSSIQGYAAFHAGNTVQLLKECRE
jgi:AraC-like DNA-binding protein/mannose-6-phosphate isomerase-like protein (cupin superfamily)